MFTVREAVRGLVVAGALLAASATLANDVTSDRHQASLRVKEPTTDQKATAAEHDGVHAKMNGAHPCTCSQAAPKAKPNSPELEAELDLLRSQGG